MVSSIKLRQLVLVGENELVTGRQKLLLNVLKKSIRHLFFIFDLHVRLGCGLTQKHGFLLFRVDLVFLFIDEVDAHSHVVIHKDLMRLIQLHARELVLACGLIRVQSIVEEFGSHRHVRLLVAQLEARVEAVWVLLLKLLVPLGRSRNTLHNGASLSFSLLEDGLGLLALR